MGIKWSIPAFCAAALLVGEGCQRRKGSAGEMVTFEGPHEMVVATASAYDGKIVFAIYQSHRGMPEVSSSGGGRDPDGGIRQWYRFKSPVGSTVFEAVKWRAGETPIVVAEQGFNLAQGEVFLVAWHEGNPRVTQVAHRFEDTDLDYTEIEAYEEKVLKQLASGNQQVAEFIREQAGWHPESPATTGAPDPAD
jgi:hypothetical protein